MDALMTPIPERVVPSIGPEKDLTKLKEKTDDFEAVILKQMLDIAMKEEDSLFGETTGSHIYRSMYHDTLGKTLAGGFGYSELLFEYLKENV